MESLRDKILIVDEVGFSRVCSALLENEGFDARAVGHGHPDPLSTIGCRPGLVIASYPSDTAMLQDFKKHGLPMILLADHISNDLLEVLEGLEKTYCMIKPLDYQKFRELVHSVMSGGRADMGGYCIV